ncbi:unnamed protein product [Lymnaea stagnalis]|uniref:EGF-like domain-containing protein n=1 Tax=Lymnaea stagnalis TaxID=6523 RepID=A0AAV2HJY0_LYMST
MVHLARVVSLLVVILTTASCAVIWDPCGTFNCQNGGSCTAPADAPYCLCPNGFTGTHCQLKGRFVEFILDPCTNYHCQNGGHCFAPADAPRCVCPSAFTGTHCQDVV